MTGHDKSPDYVPKAMRRMFPLWFMVVLAGTDAVRAMGP